jgi:hypothetical protein
LTFLAQGPLPDFILLEDAHDLLDFLEVTRRTIPRTKWAVESIEFANMLALEATF